MPSSSRRARVAVPVPGALVSTAVAVGVALAVSAAVGGCPAPATLNLGITAEEHTSAYFPITGDAPHALGATTVSGPMSCGSCHGGTASFAIAKCIECHQNDAQPPTAVHAGIAGFLAANSACLSCHPDGTRGAEQGVGDHSIKQFPIDPDDVHGGSAYAARIPAGASSCTACHASVTDRSVVLCAECHAADTTPLATTHEAILRAFEPASVACKECHADVPLPPGMRPGDHVAFYVDHYGAVCSSCHQAARAAPKEWAVDFDVASCTGCHNHPPACSPANTGVCSPSTSP